MNDEYMAVIEKTTKSRSELSGVENNVLLITLSKLPATQLAFSEQ
jgi:hypothetical protein